MNKTLTIPTSWDDITIGQFQEYTHRVGDSADNTHKVEQALLVLCNIDEADVQRLSAKDMMRVMSLLQFIDSEPVDSTGLVQQMEIAGIEVGFIPNWTQLTLGEYVDLESYCVGGDMVMNLHKAVALMYRPITNRALHQYEIAPYNPNPLVQESMKQVPMSVAVSAVVFFYNIGKAFASDLQSSSRPPKGQIGPTHSGLNGAGIE